MLNLMLTLALAATPQAKPATNIICPVKGGAVDSKSRVVTVKGQYNQDYKVCCADCETKLPATPDTYLKKDGTPKNAGKPAGMKAPQHDGHMH